MSGRRRKGPGGKLRAVARAWAQRRGGGRSADDPYTQAALAALTPRDDGLEIPEEDFDTVRLFFALHSQWRLHAMAGVRLGLDYAAVPATAAMMGIAIDPQRFADLQTMEGAALAAWAR